MPTTRLAPVDMLVDHVSAYRVESCSRYRVRVPVLHAGELPGVDRHGWRVALEDRDAPIVTRRLALRLLLRRHQRSRMKQMGITQAVPVLRGLRCRGALGAHRVASTLQTILAAGRVLHPYARRAVDAHPILCGDITSHALILAEVLGALP
jgi:hypothetical protein